MQSVLDIVIFLAGVAVSILYLNGALFALVYYVPRAIVESKQRKILTKGVIKCWGFSIRRHALFILPLIACYFLKPDILALILESTRFKLGMVAGFAAVSVAITLSRKLKEQMRDGFRQFVLPYRIHRAPRGPLNSYLPF